MVLLGLTKEIFGSQVVKYLFVIVENPTKKKKRKK